MYEENNGETEKSWKILVNGEYEEPRKNSERKKMVKEKIKEELWGESYVKKKIWAKLWRE